VHPAGSDSNDGSLGAPFATPGKALSCAYQQEVRVAEGSYDVITAMTQNPDVMLKGGYSSDFSTRDSATYPTVINVSTMTGPAITAMFGEMGMGLIDGIVFNDLRSDSPTLVLAEATLSNNTFNCPGTCVSARGKVINNTMNGAVTAIIADGYDVLNNTISSNVANATGIRFDGSLGGHQWIAYNTIELTAGGKGMQTGVPGALTVEANVIRISGGDGTGMFVVSRGTQTLQNNVVELSGTGVGVIDNISGTSVWNNTIIGAAGGTYEGIRAVASGGRYVNNIITLAAGVCVREYAITSDPAQVENNDLFGCSVLYQDEGSNDLTTISSVNTMTDITVAANVSVNPALNATDASLTASSPTAVTRGGGDLSAEFTTDFTGYIRTAPWSMGAYEYD